MKLEGEGTLLRIYIGDSGFREDQPLYEAIVLKARERGLAGATVLRGPMGFGASSRIHRASIWQLTEALRVVIEIVDREEAIQAFLPVLDEMVTKGLITLEKVHIVRYRKQEP